MKRNFLFMLLLTLLPFVGWAGDFPSAPNPAPTWKTGDEPVALVTPGTLENIKWFYYYVEKNGSAPTAANQFSTDVPKVSQTGSWDVYYIGLDTEESPNPEEVNLTDADVERQASIGWSNCSFTVTVSAPTDDTTQGDATQVELQVTPVSGQSFPYQTPIDQIVVGANMVSITVNPAQANPFLDEADEGRSIIAQYLKIDNAAELASHQVGEAPYRFAAKTQEELDAEFGAGAKTAGKIVKDGVTYYIKPILSGVINIVAGENELLNFGTVDNPVYAFAPITGIPYDGKAHDLVEGNYYNFTTWSAETGGWQYAHGTARFVKYVEDADDEGTHVAIVEVLTNTADGATTANDAAGFVGKFYGIVVENRTTIPEGRVKLIPIEWDYETDPETGDEVEVPMYGEEEVTIWAEISEKWAKYTGPEDLGVQFYYISKKNFEAGQELEAGATPAAFDPATFEIPANAEWSTNIPKGTDVDEYYIYAKATDGNTNFEGGEPVFIGTATIVKSRPEFKGSIKVDDTYFVWNNNDAWKNLKKEIKPTLNATLATGVAADAKDVTYYVQRGTKPSTEGGDYTWYDIAPDYTTLENWQDFTVDPDGEEVYRLIARFNGNANYDIIYVGESSVFSNVFEIVRPKVTIETTVAQATYPVGTDLPYEDLGYKKPVVLPTGFTATELGFKEPTSNPSYSLMKGGQDFEGWLMQAGTYEVYVDEDEFEYDGNYCEIEVKPATVTALAGDMAAAIEDQTLVFGDPLPLTLKYVNGYAQTETQAIESFEKQVYSNGTFVATMIKDAEGNDVAEEDAQKINLYGASYTTGFGPFQTTNWVTTILPVGTWKVSADFSEQNANADFKMYVSSGTWKVTPRDITDDGVRGFGRSFNPHKTYTSEAIELEERDFEGTEARYRAFNQLPNGLRISLEEAERKGLIYGKLYPYFEPEVEETAPATGDAQPDDDIIDIDALFNTDFKIVGYKDNIHAGTATVTIQGINNFEGTRDLTFTIDKARLLVYPIEATWTLGTPEAYEYDVDGAGISIPYGEYDEEVDGPGREVYAEDADPEEDDPLYVITYEGGIKTQLKHYFPGDKDLDVTTAKGFKDLVVLRDVRPNVGYYQWGLVAAQKKDEATGKIVEADDYEFDFMYAPLTIEKGKIKVQVAAAEATYQGTTKSDYTQDFELANADELAPAIAENWKTVVTIHYDAAKFTDNWAKDANNRFNAGSYTITAAPAENKTWADVFTANNYEVTIVTPATATLTVNPRETTITADDFDASYANYMTGDAFDADKLAKAIAAFETVKVGDAVVPNAESVTIDPALAAGDKIQDVISKITVDQANKVVTVTTVDNANYAITVVEGEVITDGTASELVLLSEMEDAVEYEVDAWGDPVLDKDGKPTIVEGSLVKGDMTKLNDYNGVAVRDISLTLKAPKLEKDGVENKAFAVWNKNEWHAMVLPFAVTAQDLSYAFGDTYVIVNVVDAENTTENDVRFMLPVEIEKEIPANTPFCVKVAQDFDYEDALTFHRADKFEPFTIVKPASDIVAAANFDNAWGYTFEGTYKQELVVSNATPDLRFLGPTKWYFIKPESTTTKYYMQPYTGYVNLGAGSETREVTFTFEEEDGSTTAIKAVDFQNGNKANAEGLYRVDGIKLQSAPTQKGVYIQDGKKFVK